MEQSLLHTPLTRNLGSSLPACAASPCAHRRSQALAGSSPCKPGQGPVRAGPVRRAESFPAPVHPGSTSTLPPCLGPPGPPNGGGHVPLHPAQGFRLVADSMPSGAVGFLWELEEHFVFRKFIVLPSEVLLISPPRRSPPRQGLVPFAFVLKRVFTDQEAEPLFRACTVSAAPGRCPTPGAGAACRGPRGLLPSEGDPPSEAPAAAHSPGHRASLWPTVFSAGLPPVGVTYSAFEFPLSYSMIYYL